MLAGKSFRFLLAKIIRCYVFDRLHPRTKLDVGYRLSRSGLAVAYGFKNVTYQGPIIADISVAQDSSKINVTYSNVASPSIELRNENGFEVCFIFSYLFSNTCCSI
jgi:sialate O-acetylesterase